MSRPPPPRAQDLRILMQRLFRRFGALSSDTTPCGKPLSMAHAHALMILLAGGELSQQALGAALGIDKSNVARLCARMVEVGHVTQEVSPDDGRGRRVALTARGARLAREVDAASAARYGALLGAIPAARRPDVLAALEQVLEALATLSTEGAPRAPAPARPRPRARVPARLQP